MREIRLTSDIPSAARVQTLDNLLGDMGDKSNNDNPTRLWIEDVQDGDDEIADKRGFKPYRNLLKMSCQLPLQQTPPEMEASLSIRSFVPEDVSEFLLVQNRAFDWHPEEANMDVAELTKRQGEPWYDPEDFLLLEENSKIIGFCWTKIHTSPPAGEIYMVGIDPDYQGRSLGKLMTYKGFQHLSERGQTLGILYVESDNYSAVATYEKLGLKIALINRAYLNHPVTDSSSELPENSLPKGEEKKIFVRQMFNRIAKRYDLMNSILTFGMDTYWRKKALKAAVFEHSAYKTQSGELILADLACGTGDFICQLMKRHPEKNPVNIQAVGFDFSEKMLEIAKVRIPGSAQLVCADVENLPVPDNSFDSVTLGFALRNLIDIPAALKEISRIMSPGGRLAILEVSTPKSLLLRKAHSLYFGSIVPLVGKILSDAPAYKYLPDSVAYLPSAKDLRTQLETAGFNHINMRPLSLGTVSLVSATRAI